MDALLGEIFCACGCGGRIEVKPHHKYHGVPKYIRGHNSRKIFTFEIAKRVENWDKYKDLEYYPDRVCECGCEGRIKVKSCHKYNGIPNYIKGHNQRGKKYVRSEKAKEKMRLAKLGKPQSDEHVRKRMKGCKMKPNKQEKRLHKILHEILLGKYAINVDADIAAIGGKVPDFVNINGQKRLIELFGDYWHGEERTGRTKEEEEKQRIDHFARFGYQTLIIWQHELGNTAKVKEKILRFEEM